MKREFRHRLMKTVMIATSLALVPMSAAYAEPTDVSGTPEDIQKAPAVVLPDITRPPAEVVPAKPISDEELARRQEALEAAARAEEERRAAEEAERRRIAEEQAKIEAERRAAEEAKRAAEEAEHRRIAEEEAARAAEEATRTRGNVDADSWGTSRPEEGFIATRVKSLVGQTIVDIVFDGAEAQNQQLARGAILSRPGDVMAADTVEKDRSAIYDTGLFYDIFPTFETVPEGVIITYHILENPVLSSVEITGNKAEKTKDIAALVTVKPGEMLNTRTLHENLQAISNLYHKDGYILVKVNNLDIGRDGKLTIAINEGVLEGYTVKGNTKTKDRVVIREMRMKPGEAFNAKKARRSMQRVYNLGFFDDVNMKLNPGTEPNSVVLEVDVVEKRTGTFTVGAGYSSSDGFIGMVGVGDKNFRGIGDAINLTYEFSGDDEDAHGYVFSYRRPWLDSKETSATFRIYNRTYEYDDYDTHGNIVEEYMRKYSGVELTFGRPWSEVSTNFITLRNRKDRYIKHNSHLDRSGDDYKKWRTDNFGTTRSVILEHVSDTRDNVFFPMTGSRVSLSADFAGLGGDFRYQKLTFEDNLYYKVGHAQVFALRGMYGRGYGHIPESGQYRIGGQNTLRGYRDEQFRGDSVLLGTVEYRFPVVSKVQGALFSDFGGTWDTGWQPEHMHSSVGVGMSIQTPVGPIRVDLAHGSQGNRVHFSVGGTF